ncbi:hypothetical protein G3576_30410 [Roseomonas stagni]|uniref:Dienelactone hydrolase domain-containing protein n=1 Tax=Falsiroseomonas algicola TaxID=2716930 RepID=A0A6M1LV39_9PROT|nr:dienelactone hydrolase family protein [Falsiroseomonas algicola]NGM24340.1 hypothetical protein [Falsiroseomonas algicola]
MRKFAAIGLLALSACGPDENRPVTTSGAQRGVEATWEQALVILPGQTAPTRLSEVSLPADRPIPLVIYSHGCNGLRGEATLTLRLLSESGFAVIAPDYFARSDARQVCTGREQRDTVRIYDGHVERRIEEARYAADRARSIPWVDRRRIFVVGHSVGGAVASQWSTADVAGVAILGYDCADHRALGVRAPASVRVLAMSDARDPWYPETRHGMSCSQRVGDRPNFTSVILNHGSHFQMQYADGRAALVSFLRGSGS